MGPSLRSPSAGFLGLREHGVTCGPWQRLTPIAGVPFGGTRRRWLLQGRSASGRGGRAVGVHCPQHEGSRSWSPVPHNSVLRCLGDKGVGGLPAAKGFRCRERPGLPVCPPSLHTCPGSPGATVHITHIPHFLAMEMGSFLGMFNAGNKARVLIGSRELAGLWEGRTGRLETRAHDVAAACGAVLRAASLHLPLRPFGHWVDNALAPGRTGLRGRPCGWCGPRAGGLRQQQSRPPEPRALHGSSHLGVRGAHRGPAVPELWGPCVRPFAPKLPRHPLQLWCGKHMRGSWEALPALPCPPRRLRAPFPTPGEPP